MGAVEAVYVVEPDAAIRDAIETLLSAFDVPVFTYATPQRFFASITKNIRGCIVCESLLPASSGLQVARDLREKGVQTPLLLIVDNRNTRMMEAAVSAGAHSVLEKPLITNDLIQALEEIDGSVWPGLSLAQGIDAMLNNGTPVKIRPLMPSDQVQENFTPTQYPEKFALIALVAKTEGSKQVGVARYVLTQAETAEFVIAVADEWQRKGLASLLLQHLLVCAEKAGIQNFSGLIKRDNQAMLALAQRFQFSLSADEDNSNLVVATKKLGQQRIVTT